MLQSVELRIAVAVFLLFTYIFFLLKTPLIFTPRYHQQVFATKLMLPCDDVTDVDHVCTFLPSQSAAREKHSQEKKRKNAHKPLPA